MAFLIIVVVSAALVAFLWHGLKWSWKIDHAKSPLRVYKDGSHDYLKMKSHERHDLDAKFDEIIDDLKKDGSDD